MAETAPHESGDPEQPLRAHSPKTIGEASLRAIGDTYEELPESVALLEVDIRLAGLNPRPDDLSINHPDRPQYSTIAATHIQTSLEALNKKLGDSGQAKHPILNSVLVNNSLRAHFNALKQTPAKYQDFKDRYIPLALKSLRRYPQIRMAVMLNRDLNSIEHPLGPTMTDTLIAYGRALQELPERAR